MVRRGLNLSRDQLATICHNDPQAIRQMEKLFGVVNALENDGASADQLFFIGEKADFPAPVGGIITLADNATYWVTANVDLTGDRLVAGRNTTILGSSSENCSISSTGLEEALVTSTYSLPMRGITLTAKVALDLDATGNANQALDWFGVNFTNCETVGTIRSYNNFIATDCAWLNSQGLTFDGSIGTVGFSSCLFDVRPGGTGIILPSTLTIERRFRIIYSAWVVLSGETGIDTSGSPTIPDEAYILDTVNFGGGGTYLAGIVASSGNTALFKDCIGITNTSTRGVMYMLNNATATTITAANTWVKADGSTQENTLNSKFSHSKNRLIYTGAFDSIFLVIVMANLAAGNNNRDLGIAIAKNGTVITESEMTFHTKIAGDEYSGGTQALVELTTNDYIEVWVKDVGGTGTITMSDMTTSVQKSPT